jgi:hypothetical protein
VEALWQAGLDGQQLRGMIEDLLWLRSARPGVRYLQRSVALTHRGGGARDGSPILILQQGKVGSISVLDALRSAGRRGVVHLHHVAEDAARWMRHTADAGADLNGLAGRSEEALEWAASRLVRVRYGSYLLRNADRYAPKVIVPVRDPVARSLSLCYHAMRPLVETIPERDALRRLVETYESHFWLWADATPWEVPAFLGSGRFDGNQGSWFQRELAPALGANLLAREIDLRSGFAIEPVGATRVLLLRTERMDEVLPTALAAFLGIKVAPIRANLSGGERYAKFTRTVRIAAASLDRLLGSADAHALFGDDERERSRKRWTE